MSDLAGKVAIITGGTAGIGRATAELFIARGMKVTVTGRDLERAQVFQPFVKQGNALFIRHDAGDEQGWPQVIGETIMAFGRIDILVNNAGRIIVKPLELLSLDDFQTMLRANLDAAFLGLRSVWPHFVKQGGGVIVNVSALMGERTAGIGAAYSAAKGAQQALSKAATLEGAPHNIRVCSLLPGVIWSDGWKRMAGTKPEEVKAGLAPTIPWGRVGEPREVAEAIAFLVGDDGRYLTGLDMIVDGGKSAA